MTNKITKSAVNSSPKKTLEFYFSSTASDPKLHLELDCSGLRYQRVHYYPERACVIDHECSTAKGAEGALARLYECRTRRKIGRGKVEAARVELTGPLSAEGIVTHRARACRVCALEQVIELAARSGKRQVAVTFSGQFVPEEQGTAVFSWEEVSVSGRARLERIAGRLGWPVIRTSSGPVTYGKVSAIAADILERNLRTYRLGGELAQHCKHDPANEETATQAISTYWMLRNHRPPELYGEERKISSMAKILSHL